MWTFSFCSNARSFDRPTVAKSGEKIKVPIFIRRKGADVFCPALVAGGSLMAYKCLPLCGLFSFFKGFGENLFHAGFQFIQIECRSLHGKTENLLLFRVGEIALIVLKHPLPYSEDGLFIKEWRCISEAGRELSTIKKVHRPSPLEKRQKLHPREMVRIWIALLHS